MPSLEVAPTPAGVTMLHALIREAIRPKKTNRMVLIPGQLGRWMTFSGTTIGRRVQVTFTNSFCGDTLVP